MRSSLLSLLILAAAPAQAFEITGGSIGVSHETLTSSENKHIDKSSLDGQIEFGITEAFGVQLDAGQTEFSYRDKTENHYTLHLFYKLGTDTAIGAYFGRNRVHDTNYDTKGIEIDHRIGQWSLEAYAGRQSEEWSKGDVYGARADFSLTEASQIGLRYDRSDMRWNEVERIAVTAEYQLQHGFAVTGEIGKLDTEYESDPFVGLGLTYQFGTKGKTTFAKRNLSDIYPIAWGNRPN